MASVSNPIHTPMRYVPAPDNPVASTLKNKVVDALIWVWYALRYAFYTIMSFQPFRATDRALAEKFTYPVTGRAKWNDLSAYVAARRNPTPINAQCVTRSDKKGLKFKGTVFPKPFTGGNCFGNVALFFQLWLEGQSLETILNKFEGGSPIEGAFYQAIYEKPKDLYLKYVYKLLREAIRAHESHLFSFDAEKPKWLAAQENMILAFLKGLGAYLTQGCPLENGWPISFMQNWMREASATLEDKLYFLEGLDAFLSQGKRFENGEFISFMESWVKREKGFDLTGAAYSTVRFIAATYEKKNFSDYDTAVTAFGNIGLAVENSYVINKGPAEVLSVLPSLGPGAYQLSIPAFSPCGNLRADHALGFVIDESGKATILDSSFAFGSAEKDELQATIGKLFTRHTGLDFSETLEGKPLPWWERALRFLKEEPNAPAAPLTKRFGLLKIALATE